MIRVATMADLARAHEVIGIGRAAMRAAGNTVQWSPDGSTEAGITEDISLGRCYVLEDERGIYGVFALVMGDDPTYEYIEGAWQDDSPYGTIHRIASDGTHRGVLAECVKWSMAQIPTFASTPTRAISPCVGLLKSWALPTAARSTLPTVRREEPMN